MAKLRVPSLQHLVRNWKPESGMISRDLVRLAQNPPNFNYAPVFSATYDLLYLKQPLDQVEEGIRRAIKRDDLKKNFLEILPLIDDHFKTIEPNYVNKVATQHYPIRAELMIPFTPPLYYGVGGKLNFPWFSFWKANPISGENLSLFVTMVDELLQDDPDLMDADFSILDFSAPTKGANRSLKVIHASDIPRIDDSKKLEMLEVFYEGFTKAVAILDGEPNNSETREERDDARDNSQLEMFDFD